ncbi:MAG: hypothetical protein E6G10_06265 [Actinobacteria bacterium]|nr:MAG: hypothetical protein E6G10_06265 [Actinomycetota bacterium]
MAVRVFMYAQDNRGLGHVRRCAIVAEALLRRRPDAAVLLATKSPWAPTIAAGERFDVLKLPEHLARGTLSGDERRAESSALHRLRRVLLREAVTHFRPDLILIDNEPLGFRGEMLEALDAAPAGCRFAFGMRDVVDDPERTVEQWANQGVPDALRERFDRIVIYGHPDLFDTLGVYGVPAPVRAKAAYGGYVCARRDDLDAGRFRAELGLDGRPLVLVTGGGGEDALALLVATIEAHALVRSPARLLLVTGPFMRPEDRARVVALAAPAGHVVRDQADVVAAMAASQAVATMGGYNTLAEAMMLGRRPVVVPRATHKREQLMRAEAFAARGLVHCLPPTKVTPALLAAALEDEIERPTAVEAHDYLDVDGERAAALLLETLA